MRALGFKFEVWAACLQSFTKFRAVSVRALKRSLRGFSWDAPSRESSKLAKPVQILYILYLPQKPLSHSSL